MTPEALAMPAPHPSRLVRTTAHLARPWQFPAGHADAILCRRHPRYRVQIPIEITLARPDGVLFDKGTGVIRNLSYSGLHLGDVSLTWGSFLAAGFGIELGPALESRGGRGIAGRILRTHSLGYPAFAIEFLDPESGAEEQLRRMSGLQAADPSDRAVGPLPEEPLRRGS